MSEIRCPHCQTTIQGPIPAETKKLNCPSCGKAVLLDGLAHLPTEAFVAKTQELSSEEIARDPLVGRTLGGCQILTLLGRGAMGSVYKAKQLSLDRTVAVKTIRPEFCTQEHFLQRFRQEARTVGRFSTPYIVQIHEVGYEEGTHFLIMEFVGGGSLWSFAASKPLRRLPAQDSVRFLAQGAEGLLEAEKLQIVHRDIKPENLLLTGEGRIKIADFGIAKILDSGIEMTMSAAILGTPLYMSPEQGLGKQLDHRSDMYSLGASFYHLLTGAPPVQGESVYDCIRKKTEIDCLSPSRIVMDQSIPGPLSGVIEKMTARAPEDRYASFADLLSDLEKVRSGHFLQMKAPPKGWKKALVGGLAAMILGGGFVVYHLKTRRPPPARPAGTPLPERRVEEKRDPELVAQPTGSKPEPKVEPRPEPPKVSLSDLEAELARLREEFRESPTDVLRKGGQELLGKVPQDLVGAQVLRSAVTQFIEDAQQKERVILALKVIPPVEDEGSIPQVVQRWREIQDKLAPPGDAGPELRHWLEGAHRKHLNEFRSMVRKAALPQREKADAAALRFERREMGTWEFKAELDRLEGLKAKLEEQFPGGRRDLEETFAESWFAGLRERVAEREAQEKRVGELGEAVSGLRTALGTIRKVDDWASQETDLRSRIERVEKDLSGMRAQDPGLPLKEIEDGMKECRSLAEGWGKKALAYGDAVSHLEARRLSEAGKVLASLAGDPSAATLATARDALERAFQSLLALDLDKAQRSFQEARDVLAELPVAAHFAEQCLERLRLLAEATRSMAKVGSGEVQLPDQEPRRIEAFFLDSTEVSIKSYRKFLKDFVTGKPFPEVRDLWPDVETFQKFKDEPPYLAEYKNVDESWPIEEVNYFQAMAFLKASKKDLPSLEEWWLAAKGPGGRRKAPWPGSFETLASEDLYRSPERPTAVNKGGKALGFGGPFVHHLAGNVAEWTKPRSGKDRKAHLVGGRYTDADEGHFTGENRDVMELEETARGYGFRGVIRPAEFFADLLPKG